MIGPKIIFKGVEWFNMFKTTFKDVQIVQYDKWFNLHCCDPMGGPKMMFKKFQRVQYNKQFNT